MTRAFARFSLLLCLTWTLQGCSAHGLTKRPLPTRPELFTVKVQNCRDVKGEQWCDITIKQVLLNDEGLKSHILKMEAEPVWIK
jgi:hypothetical protein